MGLEVKDLNKGYNGIDLYRDFSLSFPEGTITCILGPSGCGKTTLLNIIGRITSPDSGKLTGFEGKRFSYIFQEARLLPWKSVQGNIEFVMSRELTAHERHEQASGFIRLVDLEGFAGYYPSQLSGGMRQRVSIARAFACNSDIILMDEPLKGLDLPLKQSMIKWFSQIWKADRRTVIFVTHDVDEALLLGKEVVVFSRPPVRIVTHVKIEELTENRFLENDRFKKLKQILINALEV
ncbi:MAG: ATP-binding cassette domain-containing protein [Prolixibacteraceae bacterium]|jgi:NitT/TauT family transport system ATP-binding protein|nr:ATP-binding cassette domain-containing protein [Prolixibacteraceae bacterium]